MENKANSDYIDFGQLAVKVWRGRKLFYKVLPVVFVLSCAYTLCLPRYYKSELQLVPEMGSPSAGGGLADIAASFGFDLGGNQTGDAISPLLYPDLMSDNGFVADLFSIRVHSFIVDEGEAPIDTTYYAYMRDFQKRPFWSTAKIWITKMLARKDKSGSAGGFNPYHLSKRDDGLMESIRENIDISIDKKTAVISISTKAQDPLIAKTLADSVKERLQVYITNYRTGKARIDMEYYRSMADAAKAEYDSVRYAYAHANDRNLQPMLHIVSEAQEELGRDMQLKYNTYTAMETQYQAALARVQERTPAFTLFKGAAVPVKHSGPKRMIIVIGLLFLAFCITSLYIVREDLKEIFKA